MQLISREELVSIAVLYTSFFLEIKDATTSLRQLSLCGSRAGLVGNI
jgi:hypothetical protein